MATLFADVVYALRLLRRSTALTATAIVTLALGIGANTTVFSLMHAVVLRPLPYDPGERVVALQEQTRDEQEVNLSHADFDDWHARAHSFDSMAIYHAVAKNVTGGIEAQRVVAADVTPQFFRVIRIQPVIGTVIGDARGQGTTPIVIAEPMWRNAFGGRNDVLGRVVNVDGQPSVIVGVMPAALDFPFEPQVWTPLDLTRDVSGRSAHNYRAIGRLRDGVSVAAAQAELSAIAANLAREYPASNNGIGAQVTTLHENLTGFLRPTLWLLAAAALLVLLIACANVANLLAAHVRGRAGELAVRSALGATPARVVRQILTESTVVALLGGIAGVLLAFWGGRLLGLSAAVRFAAPNASLFNLPVLAFTFALALLTALVCGAIPAFRVARADLVAVMRRTTTRADSDLLRRFFVSMEVAVSLALLVTAILLARSLMQLIQRPFGFNSANLTIVEAAPGSAMNANDFAAQVADRLAQVSGVKGGVAIMNEPPVISGPVQGGFLLEGAAEPDERKWPFAVWHVVNDDYFRTLGIPIVHGRAFRPDDVGAPSVVVISDTMARRFFPGGDALGKRIAVPGLDGKTFTAYQSGKPEWMTIVGVAGDVRRPSDGPDPVPELYVPFLQRPPETPLMFGIRTPIAGDAVRAEVLHAVHAVGREVPVRVRSLDDFVGRAASVTRTRSVAIEVFAFLALLLAAVGVYGVTASWVEQRRQEIGIRLAIGAQRRDIVALILGRTLTLTLIGSVAGVAVALPAARLLRSFLYGITPTDASTFVLAVVVLLASALLAVAAPLRRALQVDPAVTLRYE